MPMPELDPQPIIEAPRLHLRPFLEADAELIIEASHDPFIPEITTVPSDASPDDAVAFIRRQWERPWTDAGYSFAIAESGTDTAVGQIGLWLAHLAKGRGEVGYWVAADRRNQGFASRALDVLSEWALDNLPLQRLSLYIEPWNTASTATAARAGFTEEALLRNWELVGSEPRDMLVFARLRPAAPAR